MRQFILVAAAAIVFGALALAKVGGHYQGSRAVAIALGIVAALLDWAGPVIVQGALIELVANVHEGRRVEPPAGSTHVPGPASGRSSWARGSMSSGFSVASFSSSRRA